MQKIDQDCNKEELKGPSGQPLENSLCGPEAHSSCRAVDHFSHRAGEQSKCRPGEHPNGGAEELASYVEGKILACGPGKPSLCDREGYSLDGARELVLCIAAEPLSCNRERNSSSYESGEHLLFAPEEHLLHQTEGHSLYGMGEVTSCVAGEHALYETGRHSSCRTERLPMPGTREHTVCVHGKHSSCVAGSSSCGMEELPPCAIDEHEPQCAIDEHEPQRWHSCEPDPNVPLCSRLSLLIFCIVALNIGMFFVTMYINDCPNSSPSCFLPFLHRLSFQPLHENMLIGPSSQTLERLGALDAVKVQNAGQGWRLITCIWLHAGVVHVIVNMMSLLFIGIRLEQESGAVKIGTIFMLSGFGGSLLSVLFLQNISVGASGALFGLVGAMLSELLTNWTIYTNKCAVMSVLIFVVTANLAVGIFPFVDNFAHIGGLIVGFLLGFVLLIKPQYGYIKPSSLTSSNSMQSTIKAKYKGYQYLLWVIALILLIAGFAGVAVLVFQGVDGNKKCSWCHYMSCVPTSKWHCHNLIACDELQVDDVWRITCNSNHKTAFAPLNQSRVKLGELCTKLCS